mgnify:CR=1 FL=1|tara:strand:+ start:421 stop:537 length:117 start_codon:yes stop_codon:yes gene_type:complete
MRKCGRCMDVVWYGKLSADGMCEGCVEETNDAEKEESK